MKKIVLTKKKSLIIASVLCVIGVCCFLFINQSPTLTQTSEGVFIPEVKTAEMRKIFKEFDYDMLHHIKDKQPVPRVFVKDIPLDFNQRRFDEQRPALFVEMLLPEILRVNNTVLQEREKVLKLKKEFEEKNDLTEASMTELKDFITLYDVKFSDDLSTQIDALLTKVDAVNPTLLLAMAAQDSGFATSRYAREYNSLFNQRDWDGNGAVPDEAQKEGPQYRIKVFESIYDGLLSHIHYINTSGYLENYRIARERYRRTKNQMRGYSVAYLLINFPYKPFEYSDIIKHLILQYELTPLDFLSLEEVTALKTE